MSLSSESLVFRLQENLRPLIHPEMAAIPHKALVTPFPSYGGQRAGALAIHLSLLPLAGQ